jgi:hypothetical protein
MSTSFETNSTNTEGWLECQIDEGMFSDEKAVTYPPDGKVQKSVFVSAALVKTTAGRRGKVLVRVVRREGGIIAVLPSATQDIVYISEKDLVTNDPVER